MRKTFDIALVTASVICSFSQRHIAAFRLFIHRYRKRFLAAQPNRTFENCRGRITNGFRLVGKGLTVIEIGASAEGRISIMFPMISSVTEMRRARTILGQVQDELRLNNIPFDPNVHVGAMVEIPSAVPLLRMNQLDTNV